MKGEVWGIAGVREPAVCALSGKPVAGKHACHVYVAGAYYVSVLSSEYERWTSEHWQALKSELEQSIKIKSAKGRGEG
jgi:hypothetical protein